MTNNEEIKELSIKTLFNGNDEYLIPIYQRNYAWTNAEVEQLVMDIHGYSNKEQNYYIGTLVVFEKIVHNKKVFETIDGQQRLTTLSILLSVLKNEYKDTELKFHHLLKYESREISTDTLKYIYEGGLEVENLNPAMENAYKTIKNYLKNNIKDIKDIGKFKDYLLNNVKILRVNVPKDTDLNHYFEIMNNRGEQLEKHEVLKARMIEKLPYDADKKLFNDIWEACSDMSRYVQYGFSPDKRDKIFGNKWDSFVCSDFDSLKPESTTKDSNDNKSGLEECSFSIDDIVAGKCNIETTNEKKDDDTPDRFTSPINFSNFLLHVLKVTKDKSITLDDKGLLDAFTSLNKEFVKEFGFNLLKMRFLLDNFVIKREYTSNNDRWSLQQAYKYTYDKKTSIQYKNRFDDENLNKQILMILSMFHVSNPSQIYKYWLTGTLNFLFSNYCENGIDAGGYLGHLENLAKLFFCNRYLAKEPQEFDTIISDNIVINNNTDVTKLDQGTSVEHFIFNYLDYLLWNKEQSKYSYFSFSFSNSVEHFYPQNPIEGHKKLEDENILDNFGNLCLISVSKNAKLNNHPPRSKKSYYPNNQYDSLKQHIMMKNADNWNENSIENHKNEMLKILCEDLNISMGKECYELK